MPDYGLPFSSSFQLGMVVTKERDAAHRATSLLQTVVCWLSNRRRGYR